MKVIDGIAIMLLFILLMLGIQCRVWAADMNYTVSWIGNSFPGAKKWVQQDISDIYVTQDGTVYSIVYWDEAGAEVVVYKDGNVVDVAEHTHGWGYHAGSAIAVNSEYLYFAQAVENEGGGLVDPDTWSSKGYDWYGIGRRKISDIKQAAPFSGGKGGKGDTLKGGFLVIHELPNRTRNAGIGGLWATEKHLYVSCPYDSKVRIYDAETMEYMADWQIEKPGKMWMDNEQRLWIVNKGDASRILRYSADGELQPQKIILPEGVDPTDICIDGMGRMLISDAGIRQQIHIYRNILLSPEPDETFGVEGGIHAAKGEFGDLRFNDPHGVGSDSSGNVYVASSGSSARDAGGGGGSVVLESYTGEGKLNWRLFGLEFVDMACADPDSEVDVYTKEEHFVIDYSKPTGQEWIYKGYTVNKFKYPDDPRLHLWSAGAWLKRIQGKPFLFVHDMNAGYLQVYRFATETDGETAIPSGFFAKRHIGENSWPPDQPEKGEWIWRDSNGNGAFDDGEYITRDGNDAPSLQGWWVDSEGNIWQATETDGIRIFPFQGMDGVGNPIWNYGTMKSFHKPEQFDRIKRIRYYPETDVMYLGGTTPEHKNQHWKPMGPVICRYDDWLSGNRTPLWNITAVYEKGSSGHSSCEPMTFDITGDYIFVPYTGKSADLGFAMGHIEIFNTESGTRVGFMEPSKEVGEIGLQDIRECITVHKRSNGEYAIFLEDDWKAKVLMFRWKP